MKLRAKACGADILVCGVRGTFLYRVSGLRIVVFAYAGEWKVARTRRQECLRHITA